MKYIHVTPPIRVGFFSSVWPIICVLVILVAFIVILYYIIRALKVKK